MSIDERLTKIEQEDQLRITQHQAEQERARQESENTALWEQINQLRASDQELEILASDLEGGDLKGSEVLATFKALKDKVEAARQKHAVLLKENYGIEDRQGLLDHPDFSEEEDVKAYKASRSELRTVVKKRQSTKKALKEKGLTDSGSKKATTRKNVTENLTAARQEIKDRVRELWPKTLEYQTVWRNWEKSYENREPLIPQLDRRTLIQSYEYEEITVHGEDLGHQLATDFYTAMIDRDIKNEKNRRGLTKEREDIDTIKKWEQQIAKVSQLLYRIGENQHRVENILSHLPTKQSERYRNRTEIAGLIKNFINQQGLSFNPLYSEGREKYIRSLNQLLGGINSDTFQNLDLRDRVIKSGGSLTDLESELEYLTQVDAFWKDLSAFSDQQAEQFVAADQKPVPELKKYTENPKTKQERKPAYQLGEKVLYESRRENNFYLHSLDSDLKSREEKIDQMGAAQKSIMQAKLEKDWQSAKKYKFIKDHPEIKEIEKQALLIERNKELLRYESPFNPEQFLASLPVDNKEQLPAKTVILKPLKELSYYPNFEDFSWSFPEMDRQIEDFQRQINELEGKIKSQKEAIRLKNNELSNKRWFKGKLEEELKTAEQDLEALNTQCNSLARQQSNLRINIRQILSSFGERFYSIKSGLVLAAEKFGGQPITIGELFSSMPELIEEAKKKKLPPDQESLYQQYSDINRIIDQADRDFKQEKGYYERHGRY